MRLRHLYLLLCLIGAALPYWKLLPWLMEHGLNVSLLFQELFATRIGAFFVLDVGGAAIALFVVVVVEGGRRGVSHCLLRIAAAPLVGVWLGVAVFLFG